MEQDHDTLTVLVEQPIQAIQRWAFTINKYEAWIKYPETKGMSMEGVADWIEKHADQDFVKKPTPNENHAVVSKLLFDPSRSCRA